MPELALQALASLEALERALALLLPAAETFQGGASGGAGRQADAEDHERAARAFASAASALDSLLASSSKSHGEDRLAALRSEELALREELEAKCELVQGVAAKIDGWRLRAKEALSKAEGVASAAAAKTSSGGGNEQQQLP